MDNEKLAKAIVALYSVTNSNHDWDDTDEEIQIAAFGLYGEVDCPPIDFAVMLCNLGMTKELAADFCDVSMRELVWLLLEEEIKKKIQAILSPVEVPLNRKWH